MKKIAFEMRTKSKKVWWIEWGGMLLKYRDAGKNP